MSVLGLTSLWQSPLRLRRRDGPRVLILHYHRVIDLSSDPYLLCVTPQHFAEQLEVLAKYSLPLSLPQLVKALEDNKLSARAVVVTFDDGYADNLYHAKPLLERYGIPATVFVTTGNIGREREFWWDELDRLLLQPGTLPGPLRIKINGSIYRWELGIASRYSEEAYHNQRRWHVGQRDEPGSRQYLFRSLYRLLHDTSEAERQQILEELRAWAGVTPAGRPTHRVLTPEEIVELADSDLVEVGAHTVTHPVLALLPEAVQQAEIRQSKADLERILRRPINSFSYPHGLRDKYTADTVVAVRDTGFVCACTSLSDFVWPGTDCFQLPRLVVQDWDGETFARQLQAWSGR